MVRIERERYSVDIQASNQLVVDDEVGDCPLGVAQGSNNFIHAKRDNATACRHFDWSRRTSLPPSLRTNLSPSSRSEEEHLSHYILQEVRKVSIVTCSKVERSLKV